ncbi:hypothetical protein [Vibrio harveyi]|uniref:hypothetical protein n=1 Tax=Vibrio harveyi TaxID=669 RepID=UPI003CEBD60F
MISLNKTSETVRLSLAKSDPAIKIKAVWRDNGDDLDNDDLDLRAGILYPNGKMHFLDCERSGSLTEFPFIEHQGDIQTASETEPGSEVILMNKDISKSLGGKVAVVFSVYSAVANGAVSIASLRPKMVIEFGDQKVECELSFDQTSRTVYTYVIGLVEVDGDEVVITPCGLTSRPCSEKTPWLRWAGDKVDVSFDGPQVMKGRNNTVGKVGFFGRLMGNKPECIYENIG